MSLPSALLFAVFLKSDSHFLWVIGLSKTRIALRSELEIFRISSMPVVTRNILLIIKYVAKLARGQWLNLIVVNSKSTLDPCVA